MRKSQNEKANIDFSICKCQLCLNLAISFHNLRQSCRRSQNCIYTMFISFYKLKVLRGIKVIFIHIVKTCIYRFRESDLRYLFKIKFYQQRTPSISFSVVLFTLSPYLCSHYSPTGKKLGILFLVTKIYRSIKQTLHVIISL